MVCYAFLCHRKCRLIPRRSPFPHTRSNPQGHKSIINTVLFHPLEPYIATSGIGRHVIVHSPLRLRLPERHVRELAENPCTHPHALPFRLYNGGDEAGDDDSEEGIINFFDK